MDNFVLQGEEKPIFIPEIVLNAATGRCMIQGESYLEEPFKLYETVLGWLQKYFAEGKGPAEINLKLTYINSTSSRAILEMLRGIGALQRQGKKLTVNWMYPKSNEDYNDIKEEGEDFMDESNASMNFIEY